MEFKKEDENYVYELIGRNVKKYRKLKGWTQEKLAEEINYSLSFISGIESAYHQTFSLGAIWRISIVLGVEFYKLCEDDTITTNKKYINYKCNKCNTETKIPIRIAKHFKYLYEMAGNQHLPQFECTSCDGQFIPTEPMDF
ncbi:MAG: helix-turn-helix transcriptional regulator [Bacilli bacterium]|nr:helix-turn-helix transcriptional regulator [Bacilli bacterium]MBQ3512115.1 helix-turn-helix transcriptional regulator [Bacilli bacterium]